MTSPEVSVVIPCYNEVGNIDPLVLAIKEALAEAGKSHEIVLVDDFSSDGTREKIREVAGTDPIVRAVIHKRNYGQSAAIASGYRVTRGDVVVTMDADLQNDPADIPAMLDRLQNCDAVCGIRQKRQDSRVKLMSSRIANRVRGWILKDGIHDAGCTMRAIRREALQQLPEFRALHRFLPTILKIHGFRVEEMPVRHHARTFGVSKYGVGNRLWVGLADLVGMSWYRMRHVPPNRTEQ